MACESSSGAQCVRVQVTSVAGRKQIDSYLTCSVGGGCEGLLQIQERRNRKQDDAQGGMMNGESGPNM